MVKTTIEQEQDRDQHEQEILRNIAKQILSPSNLILRDSREYSLYVCSNRAIPFVGDGFKFGQRIALWVLSTKAEKIKTVALAGSLSERKLYVHGEVSAQDTIGKLAAPYNNNVPLIEGIGHFGSRLAPTEGIGAARYTEVRRSKAAEAFLYNDLDIVPLEENYDGSNMQPKHFLPLIPTVLLNGISGIAVGWSTEILPRSLKNLIQATQDALMGLPIKGLEPFYTKYNISVKNIGSNQWEFTGKLKIVDSSTIHITELPPGEKIESFRSRLIKLEDNNEIQGFTDRSTKNIDITVKFKRGSLGFQAAKTEIVDGKKYKIPGRKAWTEDEAIKFFKIQEKVTERIVVIDWNGDAIRTYNSPEELVADFVNWRLAWYTIRFEKLKNDTIYERNYWLALATLFKDKFPNRLGPNHFSNRSEMETDVSNVASKAKIKLDDKQLDRVVSLPTYRWTKAFEAEVQAKLTELAAAIKEYDAILGSPKRLKNIYFEELEALKKMKF